jgi:hypothetical protein
MVSKKGESQAPEVVQTSTRILEDTAKTDASADTKAADTKTDDTKTADQNSKYGWGCQATSLNPNADNAAFKSKALGGYTTTAKVAVVATTGDSVLWSSFFAMIIMVVGVFFY